MTDSERCQNCGSKEWTRITGYGFEAWFCDHCFNIRLADDLSKALRDAILSEVNMYGLHATHIAKQSTYLEEVEELATKGAESDPMDVLEYIRLLTYEVAKSSHEEELLHLCKILHKMVHLLEVTGLELVE